MPTPGCASMPQARSAGPRSRALTGTCRVARARRPDPRIGRRPRGVVRFAAFRERRDPRTVPHVRLDLFAGPRAEGSGTVRVDAALDAAPGLGGVAGQPTRGG